MARAKNIKYSHDTFPSGVGKEAVLVLEEKWYSVQVK
jgi:hypothetical protein